MAFGATPVGVTPPQASPAASRNPPPPTLPRYKEDRRRRKALPGTGVPLGGRPDPTRTPQGGPGERSQRLPGGPDPPAPPPPPPGPHRSLELAQPAARPLLAGGVRVVVKGLHSLVNHLQAGLPPAALHGRLLLPSAPPAAAAAARRHLRCRDGPVPPRSASPPETRARRRAGSASFPGRIPPFRFLPFRPAPLPPRSAPPGRRHLPSLPPDQRQGGGRSPPPSPGTVPPVLGCGGQSAPGAAGRSRGATVGPAAGGRRSHWGPGAGWDRSHQ